ncbi:keratin-associated protein 9-2-like [Acipenser ruthenus]|uniref:keratin-associated protein 9-2-like n=1 Tax=Acipenser ruthenus TaxID=7906 RepID=UPI002741C8BC|nr:keratin-associated protein 9-2-like [Acipenser ruthenus]
MKVVLGILVLLHCAAQVQTLLCLTCAAGTDEASCTAINYCDVDETWCFSTYTVSGSTITVEKGCTLTCVPDPQTFCCTTIGCNVQTLLCLTCAAGTADEATCTTQVCAGGETWCFSTHTVTGSTITVEKGCAPTCVADPQTFCCTTNNCNVQTLSCLTCAAGTADEATCTTQGCAGGETWCFSTYTGTGSTITVEKGCKAACVETENPRTSCCLKNNCNVVQMRCYTCPETSDESTCTVSVCDLTQTTCMNTYKKSGTDELICFQCAEETNERYCDLSFCGAATFCQSDYKLNGEGPS